MRSLLLLAVLLVGCNKGEEPGPSCTKVIDHVLEVTKSVLPGHETTGIAGDRKASIQQCEARKLPRETRECLLAAKDLDGFGACYKAVKPPAK